MCMRRSAISCGCSILKINSLDFTISQSVSIETKNFYSFSIFQKASTFKTLDIQKYKLIIVEDVRIMFVSFFSPCCCRKTEYFFWRHFWKGQRKTTWYSFSKFGALCFWKIQFIFDQQITNWTWGIWNPKMRKAEHTFQRVNLF